MQSIFDIVVEHSDHHSRFCGAEYFLQNKRKSNNSAN